jgi:mono/diheme cytochrome c family protein
MDLRSLLSAIAVIVSPMVHAQTPASIITLTAPSQLALGQNRFEVAIKDASGNPITNADVTLSLIMPADPKTKHPEMRTDGKLNNAGGGKYSGLAMVTMAGTWNITVTATRNGENVGQTKSTLTAQMNRSNPAKPQASATPDHRPHTHTHADAAALKNPVPATSESVSNGGALFAKQCASCHGTTGKGDGAMVAKLKSKPADLTDAEWKHGPSDGEIFTLIRDGAKNAGMKAFRGALTDRQMWDLVNYIRTLGPAPAR